MRCCACRGSGAYSTACWMAPSTMAVERARALSKRMGNEGMLAWLLLRLERRVALQLTAAVAAAAAAAFAS